jgi:hypothetical protein
MSMLEVQRGDELTWIWGEEKKENVEKDEPCHVGPAVCESSM